MSNDQDFNSLIPWNVEFDDYDEYSGAAQTKVKIGNEEKYLCVGCQDFFPFAELNQTNNTFKCWSCRNGLGKMNV